MRILMFGWEFPPHITGGLGTACFGLTKGLAKHGVEVLFVVPKAFGDESREAVRIINASDVTIDMRQKMYKELWSQITYLEVSSNLLPYVTPEEFEVRNVQNISDSFTASQSISDPNYRFSGKYGKDLMQEVTRYALVAASLAAKENFDVIHAHDWLTYPAAIAAKNVSGKPLVVHMHATEFDRSGENINQNVYDIERKGMEMADRVITVSEYTRSIVIKRYGIPPEKVVAIHNGVEPADNSSFLNFERNVSEKVVTFLGRITFQKGPEYFVEVANKLLMKDSNLRFVMAGSGDMLHKIINRVAELGISTKFHFTGFLTGEEVDKMFALSDVYIMPSVSEPFGISPLEAMRSNVPVIISKQSGVSEVINHAFKIDFWDIDAMANAIYALLHYDTLYDFFKQNGQAEVENMKWEYAALKIKTNYEELIRDNSKNL